MTYPSILRKRITAEQLGSTALPNLAIWLFFQIAAGHILLPLLVATYLRSRSLRRRATLISLCCSWILTGIFSSLLFYKGTQLGSEPSKGICVTQTALLGSVPPMTSLALLVLVYNVASQSSERTLGVDPNRGRIRTAALCITPYLTFAVFVAVGAHLGSDHEDRVDRAQRFFFCSVDWTPYNNAAFSFALTASILAAALQSCNLFDLWRRKDVLSTEHEATTDFQFSVRITVFTWYNLLSAILNLVSLQHLDTAFPDIFSASVGMALFIIFGTERDIIRSWRFWRRESGSTRPEQPIKPNLTPTSPSFDLDLLKRTDSDVSEKARLEALHAYYAARVRGLGVDVQIIAKPEDAFLAQRDSGVVMQEDYGLPEMSSPIWRF
ncbi:hypothetical protein SCP_0311160 [Sparassis crispa]|uniref:Uncharacterized protein n=1 Tax=Sparassis crispa TaxID=139825 RepID=A0A401GGS5_9APHY|nr:hypothetical protein SCP_0311160 [Sparassis crispa]GBE81387.1 hypothetical protein SCP_0311160 [Sparassis crispa]